MFKKDKDKKEVVVFLGLKTTGKDYNSQVYLKNGYKKVALADPLRSMLWSILGFYPSRFTIEYNKFKNIEFNANILGKLFNFIPFFKRIGVTTVRKMLQNLGSEMKILFGEDFWAKQWCEHVEDILVNTKYNVVCTDCRFPVEIKKALSLTRKGYKVKFIWVCYENANFKEILKDKHESEALAQYLYYNREKYGLKDGTEISNKKIKDILKDYEK